MSAVERSIIYSTNGLESSLAAVSIEIVFSLLFSSLLPSTITRWSCISDISLEHRLRIIAKSAWSRMSSCWCRSSTVSARRTSSTTLLWWELHHWSILQMAYQKILSDALQYHDAHRSCRGHYSVDSSLIGGVIRSRAHALRDVLLDALKSLRLLSLE